MAEEIMSFAVQKLWDLLSQEYDQFQGVKDRVDELQTDLSTLKSFLNDADAKKHTSAMVRNCVDVIKEIICDAEDTIETFILKDEVGKIGGIKKSIRRYACIIPERREIALEIGSLSKRISKVICDMQSFGVQHIIANVRDLQPIQQRLREMRQEFSTEYKNDLVGMESNVQQLVGYLVEEDDVQVVSITGMGGLGKTTLARQAFNHHKVKEKFDRVAWVCVTQDCDRMNVWQAILQNFRTKEEEEKILKMAEATLQKELFGLLETSKSLIVFDDIWKEEDWDRIKPIFPDNTDWKVILTSRKESIARRGDRTYINYKPQCLSDQDSYSLFQRIAMPRKDASNWTKVDEDMEEMGKKMVKHCKGLPLAVRVLGGLLATNYTVHYWKRLSENIGSHLVERINDDNTNSLNFVLSLSYEELPSYLKYCFLYLAHFPEDYEINVKDLAYYWAAEGVLRCHEDGIIQDVGDKYIEDLVRRNMVISERDNTTGRLEMCHLHDLMREICLSKAKEENFLQIVGSSTAHSQSLCKSRRFVSQNPTTLDVEREINNSKVRSLVVVWKDMWRNPWNLSSINFTRLQLLRVLHLPRASFEQWKLPDSIGKLIHLRYLSIEAASVWILPSSLRNLNLLIYLNLEVSKYFNTDVPNVLMGMKELRYLALPNLTLKKTRLELSNLVNLETLINFSAENSSLEDLGGMARLRTLGIKINDESSLESLSTSIGGLRHLESLDISYEGDKGSKEWRNLLEFINLRQLKLSIDGPLLSDKLNFPSRLTSLSLTMSSLEEDPMPTIEKLGHLKELYFWDKAFCGRRMVCSSSGFPQLQKLQLWRLEELEEWIVEEGSMPLLSILIIIRNEKLKEIPDGLRFLTFLKYLSVGLMEEHWKERLSERGEDYHKVKHIPFVKTQTKPPRDLN